MNKFQQILFVILLAFTASCSEKAHEKHHDHQSAYAVPAEEVGNIQSPINIISSNCSEKMTQECKIKFNDKIKAVEHKAHTVQLDFDKGSTLSVEGKTYEFVQAHFHTPSEHMIDGMTFPMEMHVVNKRLDTDKDEYLVMGVMFKMGKESKFIEEFIHDVPAEANCITSVPEGKVKLQDLDVHFKDMAEQEFYHYNGSLTTPPYTEAVTWYVSKHIYTASQEEIKQINQLEGDNARHVQSLHGRKVDVVTFNAI